MSFFSLVLLALALSIDCFTVCLVFGMQRSAYRRALKPGEKDPFPSLGGTAAKAGLVFAVYHIIMIVLGWLLGWGVNAIVARYDHWFAFALLLGIGVKTIIDGFNARDAQLKVHSMFDWKSLLLMGLAVSIDAFAVGISLKMIEVSLLEICGDLHRGAGGGFPRQPFRGIPGIPYAQADEADFASGGEPYRGLGVDWDWGEDTD